MVEEALLAAIDQCGPSGRDNAIVVSEAMLRIVRAGATSFSVSQIGTHMNLTQNGVIAGHDVLAKLVIVFLDKVYTGPYILRKGSDNCGAWVIVLT